MQAWWQRVRAGDMGALPPAVGGLVVLTILFSTLSPFFLSERNFANLLNQAATLVMLGMALVFVLLLGEIDLSAGVTGGVGMALFVVLVSKFATPWPLALLLGFLVGVATGALIGFFVARVGIPSFVVTLGLFLGYQGLALLIIGDGGLYKVQVPRAARPAEQQPAGVGWLGDARRHPRGVGGHLVLGPRPTHPCGRAQPGDRARVDQARRHRRARRHGRLRPEPEPRPVDRGRAGRAHHRARDPRDPLVGTFVLDRTKFGRYLYAIGGNTEAARRSGIKVRWVKWWAFVICSTLAVVSALFSVTRVGSVDATVGRDIVLSGVAAAVVGGVSLFGGRGRLLHAAIGALVIAVITNASASSTSRRG